MLDFQEMILKLVHYWTEKGCTWHQGYDLEVGAGTFNPATFLRSLGPEPYTAVYVEPSRRPQDGRYGQNPNRVQSYHQMQVIFKPCPDQIQDWYLGSLEAIGLDLKKHDIRFVHDDWENPTIGASGLGWEVWIDGMEATQFTYFQTVGGLEVNPITAEITYGLERLALYLQKKDSFFDLTWSPQLSYGDVFKSSEWQWSFYNFEEADISMWEKHFHDFEKEAKKLINRSLPIPAYDFVIKASHAFNILDARGSISISERARIMARIRDLAQALALCYLKDREKLQYPLLKKEEDLSFISSPASASSLSEKEDFLLEVGVEELPANVVTSSKNQLQAVFEEFFTQHQLKFAKCTSYATPRRIAILVEQLETSTKALVEEKKGPSLHLAFDANGKPTPAGMGFFSSCGVTISSFSEGKEKGLFTIKKIKDVEYLFIQKKTAALSTMDLLSENLERLILSLEFPKKMRWDSSEITFSRPIRNVVALLGKESLKAKIGNIFSHRNSFGHRFQSIGTFPIPHPQEYLSLLKKQHVLADLSVRKQVILDQIKEFEESNDVKALCLPELIDEVTNLVEWPTLVKGGFDKKFLKAPREVVISEMKEHQRYFPLETKQGELVAHFLVISNNQSSELIAQGHSKAISARLADGLFLFEEDLKTALEKFNEKLRVTTFHQGLGSMLTKVKRIQQFALELNDLSTKIDSALVERAALLSKADLASELVKEFPHLQGIIGAIYAERQKESPLVARAIEEHWMPKSEKGTLPSSELGQIIALADKLDNLICCFSLGLIPTSSGDPFALRRQALGIIRILLESALPLSIQQLLSLGFSLLLKNPELSSSLLSKLQNEKEQILASLYQFIARRVQTVFSQQGYSSEEIEAVLKSGFDDFNFTKIKLEVLQKLKAQNPEQFAALKAICFRIDKILAHAKANQLHNHLDPKLFSQEEEVHLFEKLQKGKKEFALLEKKMRVEDYLSFFAKLDWQASVEKFFDKVIVLTKEEKITTNRLLLLKEVRSFLSSLFDFACL